MQLPERSPYVIIGAGVHGLSTAWHLATALKARGRGGGEDIIILDKTGIAAGASGIACGVVRNFYFQPAMGEVMRVSVEIWESDPEGLAYHPVGYIAAVPESQARNLESIFERHERSGYQASLVRGARAADRYMKSLFPDWQARGITTVLHEHQGGFGFNQESMQGLAAKAQGEGVRLFSGVEVTGFDLASGEVRGIETSHGRVVAGEIVVAVGPWIKQLWEMLGLPAIVDVRGRDGQLHRDLPMWTYWRLQEGEVAVDPAGYVTADGETPAVIHVDSNEPLYSDATGDLITDRSWGIYFKQDRHGVQGGAVPENIGHEAQVDPYGPASPYYVVDESFIDYWTSGLAHCLGRFRGVHRHYRQVPSGGIGCFTVDNFPVFDRMLANVYVIADSNHGYKMIGVGKEVARVLLGEESEVLHPFRFGRYAVGDLHPTSNSPFPWA